MPRNVLVVWYSQTGQLREIVDSITGPLAADPDIRLTFEELKPSPPFPFPWTSDEFFQAMPESVKGIPCGLEPLKLKGDENFDLVIFAWQPWFLSPSLPAHAFFHDDAGKTLIRGKQVVTVIGSRNMWVTAHQKILDYIRVAGGKHAGNIVLCDRAANLLSILSVIRWMFKGKKERFLKIIPPAGISAGDISKASAYGEIIRKAIADADYSSLKRNLVEAGAVNVDPGLVMMEKRGIVFFRVWAGFIMKKGGFGNPARNIRARMFKYYLLIVLYLVSPFATLLFKITAPLRRQSIKKQISFIQSL